MSNLTSQQIDDLVALSGVYRLLGRLWLREVDQPLLNELASPPFASEFSTNGANESLQDLSIDYCQLFIGPKDHLPPYQSVWQTGQFQSSTVVSMTDFVEVVGYQPPDDAMFDHLGIQLDVMAHICSTSTATETTEIFEAFFMRHLTWPTEFLQKAQTRAQTDFYRSVIRLTGEFLQSQRATGITLP